MSGINVKLEGTQKMQAALKEFKDDTFKKKVLTSAYRKAAKPFVKLARANAPIAPKSVISYDGKRIDPGTLKKSIGTWTYRKIKSPHLLMGAKHGKRSAKYDGYFYKFVEFGTAKQAAQPFLRPAWDSTQPQIKSTLEKEFLKTLNKFKSKYGL